MERDLIRYDVQLEMLERDGALGDRAATALLLSELALMQNAGRFNALATADIEFDVVARNTPQEGVTRYTVAFELCEREPWLRDAQVAAVLHRAFADAFNASCFLRICTDDQIAVTLLARESADAGARRLAA